MRMGNAEMRCSKSMISITIRTGPGLKFSTTFDAASDPREKYPTTPIGTYISPRTINRNSQCGNRK